MEKGQRIYCEWDCKNDTSAYIMMANSLIAAVLLLVSIKLYLLYKERLNPGISKFYFCLMAWAVAYSLKNMFSLVVYYTVFQTFRQEQTQEQILHWNQANRPKIQEFSAFYLIMDCIPPLILQTLLFLIPYHMIERVMNILKNNFGLLLSTKQLFWRKTLRIYKYFRSIIIIPIFMLFFYNKSTQYLYAVSYVVVSMICFDCFVCNVLIIFAYRYITSNYRIFRMESSAQSQKLKKQFILLSLSAIFRFIIDLTFYVIIPHTTDQYVCLQKIQNSYQYIGGYVVAGSYLMHFFPVCISLYIYKPQ